MVAGGGEGAQRRPCAEDEQRAAVRRPRGRGEVALGAGRRAAVLRVHHAELAGVGGDRGEQLAAGGEGRVVVGAGGDRVDRRAVGGDVHELARPRPHATKPSSVLVGVSSRGPAAVSGAALPFAQLSSWPVVALANTSAGGSGGGLAAWPSRRWPRRGAGRRRRRPSAAPPGRGFGRRRRRWAWRWASASAWPSDDRRLDGERDRRVPSARWCPASGPGGSRSSRCRRSTAAGCSRSARP